MLLQENEVFVVIDGNELQASEIIAMRVSFDITWLKSLCCSRPQSLLLYST